VNVYDVVNHEWLVLSKKAAQALGERLAGSTKGRAKAKDGAAKAASKE
jgi:hypothetical protein